MNGQRKALATLIATGALAGAAVTLEPGSIGSGPERAASRAESACDLSGSRISQRGWRTDFSTCSVPLQEFRPGGPARDGIPPLDQPRFESVGEARAWLRPREPVIFVEVYGDRGMVRGYYAPMSNLLITQEKPGGPRRKVRKFYPEIVIREKLKSWTSTALLSFQDELADFLRMLRGERVALADGFAGFRAVEIANAVYESTRTGSPVQLTQRPE